MEEMLSFSLTYGDELWHVMLYQWLIDNALTDRLLEVGSCCFPFRKKNYESALFNEKKWHS